MTDQQLVNIKINEVSLQVPKGEMIIESARRIGVDIPFFCYHPRLSMKDGGANCRMCLVEVASRMPDGSVRKMPKPQTSCSLPASEGMEIQTETEALAADRRGVLEFLLINHPLDCPICDRGGECPLQNNTLHYGPPTTRYIEEKRHFPKAFPLSKHVVFDRERCIHCARCTRFTRDISGDDELNFLWRGADMEVSTFQKEDYSSRFSGNVIELCPVGALLSRDYRFKARPWDLRTQKSICTRCSNGCNIKIDYRDKQLLRVNARLNEAVNEEWTCDRGKFGMGYVSDENRLLTPMMRKDGELVPASWEEVIERITIELKKAGSNVGGIGGARRSNEDLFVWQRLFREAIGSQNLDHRIGPNLTPTNGAFVLRHGHRTMGMPLADLENMKAVLVIGSDLVDEQPILYLRVRKGWRLNNMPVIEAVVQRETADEIPGHVEDFATVSLQYLPGSEIAFLQGLLAALKGDNDVEEIAKACGVDVKDLRTTAECLHEAPVAIIAGKSITDRANREDLLKLIGDIAECSGSLQNVIIPTMECNEQGAMDMGILPDVLPGYVNNSAPGMNTVQMLQSAAEKELGLLWIVDEDIVNSLQDKALAEKALVNCPFVIVNVMTMTDTARLADIVLPVQSVAERPGTMTNVEGRVQRFLHCLDLSQEIRPDWLIFANIAGRLGVPMLYASARDILRDIAAQVAGYSKCGPAQLKDEGVIRDNV